MPRQEASHHSPFQEAPRLNYTAQGPPVPTTRSITPHPLRLAHRSRITAWLWPDQQPGPQAPRPPGQLYSLRAGRTAPSHLVSSKTAGVPKSSQNTPRIQSDEHTAIPAQASALLLRPPTRQAPGPTWSLFTPSFTQLMKHARV